MIGAGWLAAQRAGFELNETPIDTVYLDDNASSHFRTVRDQATLQLAWSDSTGTCFRITFLPAAPARVVLPRPRDYDDPAVFEVNRAVVKSFLETAETA